MKRQNLSVRCQSTVLINPEIIFRFLLCIFGFLKIDIIDTNHPRQYIYRNCRINLTYAHPEYQGLGYQGHYLKYVDAQDGKC